MIYGTLYNACRMLELTQKWETKKESGKMLAKQDRELTAEERELERFREEVKTQQESSKYNAIYTKLQCGKELTSEEEKALADAPGRQHSKLLLAQARAGAGAVGSPTLWLTGNPMPL